MDITSINNSLNALTPAGKKRVAKTAKKRSGKTFLVKLTIRAAKEKNA
jgi:hypothetical protein